MAGASSVGTLCHAVRVALALVEECTPAGLADRSVRASMGRPREGESRFSLVQRCLVRMLRCF